MIAILHAAKKFWFARENLGDNKISKQHIAFLPAALEIQHKPPNALANKVGQCIIALFVIALIWACLAKVDVVAIAEGKIIHSARIKTIQPLDKGVIRQIYVEDGQSVKKGQPLIELDRTLTDADQFGISNNLLSTTLTRIRLDHFVALLDQKINANSLSIPSELAVDEENVFNENQLLQQQWRQYQAQRGGLLSSKNAKQAELETTQAQIQKLQQTLPIVSKRADNYKKLLETKMVAEDDYLKIEQERIEQEQNLQAQMAQGRQLTASMEAIDQNLTGIKAETLAQTYKQLGEINDQIETLHKDLTKATDVNAKQILYSPVDGVVQELKINTIGGIVTEAQDLMTIVPNDEVLEVQAYIENKDIGFIEVGMPAEIKVQTFPFTQYGVIDAKVKTITDDALANQEKGLFFAMHLLMAKNTLNINGKNIHLRSGMQVTAEVKTGERRVIEYLLTPVLKGFRESVRER